MPDSPAERQRRFRAHKAGNHSLCDPARCTRPAAVTRDDALPGNEPLPPARLRIRGKRLWRQLVDESNPGPAEIVLIEEACRLVDRLDRLDAIVNGADRAWLHLEVGEDGVEITVVVDKLLSEARQQQLTLKQIIGELRQAGGARVGPRRAGAPGSGVGHGVADLTARIADRRGKSTG